MIKLKMLAAFACLALAACQPSPASLNSNSEHVATNSDGGATSGTLVDERALYAAESAYNVAAHAYVTLDANGQLSPALKAQARPLMADAYAALLAARTAYRAGDAGTFSAKVSAVMDLAARVRALLPNRDRSPASNGNPIP